VLRGAFLLCVVLVQRGCNGVGRRSDDRRPTLDAPLASRPAA
jgi:hypothetical protein